MSRTLIAWDIENIKFYDYDKIIGFLGDIDKTDKFFVHNSRHSPIKKESSNFLINRGWSKFLVKPGKDSADNSISDILKNNLNKYDRFVIITGDYGFSNIISYLLKSKKNVVLLHNENSDKLLNKLYSKSAIEDIHKHLIIHCL